MRDNVSGPFDGPCAGCILTERNMGPNLIIIGRVFREDSPKVLSVEHQQMVGALAPDRSDQAFNISVLPRGTERRGSVPDPHRSYMSFEHSAQHSVVVANEIFCA